MSGMRSSICWLIVVSLGLLLSMRIKDLIDENVAQGLIWGGSSRGYHDPRRDNATHPPTNHYKLLNLKPGAPTEFVKKRCNERTAALPFSKKPTEVEQRRAQQITDACRILTVDYERCFYDASQNLRVGLWEGYIAECNYLEDVGNRKKRMDRKRENWIAWGLEGNYLATKEKAETDLDDLRIEKAREVADEALVHEKMKREERDEKRRNRGP